MPNFIALKDRPSSSPTTSGDVDISNAFAALNAEARKPGETAERLTKAFNDKQEFEVPIKISDWGSGGPRNITPSRIQQNPEFAKFAALLRQDGIEIHLGSSPIDYGFTV